jgi:hypothetical protein
MFKSGFPFSRIAYFAVKKHIFISVPSREISSACVPQSQAFDVILGTTYLSYAE